MTQITQQTPQPADSVIMAVQKEEIDRLNDNRVYLIALNRELNAEAMSEISRLRGDVQRLTEENQALSQENQALREQTSIVVPDQPQDQPYAPPTEA